MNLQTRARSVVDAARRLVSSGLRRGRREASVRRLEWQIDRQKAALGSEIYPLLQSGRVQTDVPEVRERMTRIGALIRRLEQSRPRLSRGQLGQRDAGWVQLLDIEGQRLRGRGRLMLHSERTRDDGSRRLHAQVESFVPVDELPLKAGDQVLLLIETANEQYPVTVQTIGAVDSVVTIHWTADELPATLRELGGG